VQPVKITKAEKMNKWLGIKNKAGEIVLKTSRQNITFSSCGISRNTTIFFKIWGDSKKIDYSIKSKNDPIPIMGTQFEGSIATKKLKKDTFSSVVKFLSSKKCHESKSDIMKNTKFYVSSAIHQVNILLNGKKTKVPQWSEKWSVNACDKNYKFPIIFTGDGIGGTNWDVKKVTISAIS
jgi:hypothetical protein